MEARCLPYRRAPDGPVLERDRQRVARLERAVRRLEDERDELRTDLALSRSWVRDLLSWIGEERPAAEPRLEPAGPGPLRRAATVAVVISAPWLLVGAGVAAGVALS